MPFKKRDDVLAQVKNAALVFFGSVILAIGVGLFIKPFSLVTGGISGLSIAISSLLPAVELDGVNMTMEICTALLTWVVFLLGLIFLGKSFALKTLISNVTFTLFLPVVTYVSEKGFGGFFDMRTYANFASDGALLDYSLPIISAVFGGVIIGFGCALAFRGGGSTGGMDVIALIIAKYIKRAKSSVLVFCLDAAVVVFGAFVIGDLVMTLLGITSAFINALVIDRFFIGEKKAFIANIISERHGEIRLAIIERLDRTCTVIEAQGGYTGADRPMLMVSFTMPEYASLMALVSSIDKRAFITVHRAHEIEGEGFTRYEVKRKK